MTKGLGLLAALATLFGAVAFGLDERESRTCGVLPRAHPISRDVRLDLELASTQLMPGITTEARVRITNVTDVGVRLEFGRDEYAAVLAPGTRRRVGGMQGPRFQVGAGITLAPGETITHPLWIVPDQCDAASGDSLLSGTLPPGEYDLVAELAQVIAASPGPRPYDVAPLYSAPVRVRISDHRTQFARRFEAARWVVRRGGHTPFYEAAFHPDRTFSVLLGAPADFSRSRFVEREELDRYLLRAYFFVEGELAGTYEPQRPSMIGPTWQDDANVLRLEQQEYRAGDLIGHGTGPAASVVATRRGARVEIDVLPQPPPPSDGG